MKRYITDAHNRLACSTLHARPVSEEPEMQLVKVYPEAVFQEVMGFGAALTEASGYVYHQMDDSTRRRFMQLCFGAEGNRYALGRLSIQSCDFALSPRAYLDEAPSGKRRTSPSGPAASEEPLAGFSIEGDFAYVIPLAMDALAQNPQLEFLASPWSPPAWAKTNKSMKRGGRLAREHYGTWARMIARFVAEYRALGLPVTRITMQNEPAATQIWESCLFSVGQEREFLRNHLKPALRAAGLSDVKVLAWDHNKERVLERTLGMMRDGAADDLDGIAFHWYSGDHFEALRIARDVLGPDRELVFTEGCDSYSAGDPACELPHAEHYAHEIIGDLKAGANGILDWNILLDQHGGPNHVGNFCDAPIMYDTDKSDLSVRLPYYYLGHFSRFIERGAHRILCSSYTDALETCAFENPDGSRVLVALNRTERSVPFTLAGGLGFARRRVARVDAPPHSLQTIVW